VGSCAASSERGRALLALAHRFEGVVSSRSRVTLRTHIVIAVLMRDDFGRLRSGELRRFR